MNNHNLRYQKDDITISLSKIIEDRLNKDINDYKKRKIDIYAPILTRNIIIIALLLMTSYIIYNAIVSSDNFLKRNYIYCSPSGIRVVENTEEKYIDLKFGNKIIDRISIRKPKRSFKSGEKFVYVERDKRLVVYIPERLYAKRQDFINKKGVSVKNINRRGTIYYLITIPLFQ